MQRGLEPEVKGFIAVPVAMKCCANFTEVKLSMLVRGEVGMRATVQ